MHSPGKGTTRSLDYFLTGTSFGAAGPGSRPRPVNLILVKVEEGPENRWSYRSTERVYGGSLTEVRETKPSRKTRNKKNSNKRRKTNETRLAPEIKKMGLVN